MSNKDFVAFGFEITFVTNHLKNENSWSKAVETRKIFNPSLQEKNRQNITRRYKDIFI